MGAYFRHSAIANLFRERDAKTCDESKCYQGLELCVVDRRANALAGGTFLALLPYHMMCIRSIASMNSTFQEPE